MEIPTYFADVAPETLTVVTACALGLIVLITFMLKRFTMSPSTDDIINPFPGGREMSLLEYVWIIMLEKFGAMINVYAIFVESKLPVTEELVRTAAKMVRARHPLLRMRVCDIFDTRGKKRHYFAPMDGDFVDVKTVEGDNWQDVHQQELTSKFNTGTGPLWRIRIMRNSDAPTLEDGVYKSILFVTFVHAIADGNTMMRFTDELLTNMSLVAEGKEEMPESYPLLPHAHDILGIKELNWREWITFKILVTFLPLFMSFQKKNPFLARFGTEIMRNSDAKRATCIIPIVFSKEETTKLRDISRKHKATVNGVLTAVAAVAIAEIMQDGNLTSDQKVDTLHAVNLQRFCDPPIDPAINFSQFSAGIGLPIRVPKGTRTPQDVLKLASTITRESHAKIKGGSAQWMLKLVLFMKLQNISIFDLFQPNLDDKHLGRSTELFMVSNLGNLSYFTKKTPRVFELAERHCACESTKAGDLFTHYICTVHGRLQWSLVYRSHVTSKTTAKKYADLIIKLLSELYEA
ncbi:uncharacterized protein [Ptychodera flava]